MDGDPIRNPQSKLSNYDRWRDRGYRCELAELARGATTGPTLAGQVNRCWMHSRSVLFDAMKGGIDAT